MTGVNRRQTCVVVGRGPRLRDQVAPTPPSPAASREWYDALLKILMGASLEQALPRISNRVSLEQCAGIDCRLCEELGVAFTGEIVASSAAVASKSGMKPLERKRFIATCTSCSQVSGGGAKGARRQRASFDDPEGELFEDDDN